MKIEKIDNEKMLVSGWASVTTIDGKTVLDKQDHMISTDSIELAAHDYLIKSRAGKAMHEGEKVAELVESIVFTKQKQEALGIDLGKEGWYVTFKIFDQDVWEKVKAGEYKMFSIGGKAKKL